MKDGLAREGIEKLRERLRKLEAIKPDEPEVKEPNFIIRQCPKCKHETVQVKKWNYVGYMGYSSSAYPLVWENVYNTAFDYTVCTNCGTKVKCVTETICKEYGAKPKKKKE